MSHEVIKWKKGRLIGKGAFGKVYCELFEMLLMYHVMIGMGGADGLCKANCSKGGGA